MYDDEQVLLNNVTADESNTSNKYVTKEACLRFVTQSSNMNTNLPMIDKNSYFATYVLILIILMLISSPVSVETHLFMQVS